MPIWWQKIKKNSVIDKIKNNHISLPCGCSLMFLKRNSFYMRYDTKNNATRQSSRTNIITKKDRNRNQNLPFSDLKKRSMCQKMKKLAYI